MIILLQLFMPRSCHLYTQNCQFFTQSLEKCDFLLNVTMTLVYEESECRSIMTLTPSLCVSTDILVIATHSSIEGSYALNTHARPGSVYTVLNICTTTANTGLIFVEPQNFE